MYRLKRNWIISLLACSAFLLAMVTMVDCSWAAGEGPSKYAQQKRSQQEPQQPTPAAQQPSPSAPAHKATFGPPIVVPWKRGGKYSMVDVQKSLQTLGWWISEAKNDAGEYYNPPKLELAAVDDEKWQILKKDLHMQAVKKFGKGVKVVENEKHTPQWQHKLFRGGIGGIRSAVVDIIK